MLSERAQARAARNIMSHPNHALTAPDPPLSIPEAALLSLVLEKALDAIIIIDDESRILEWNPRAEALFGWTRAEALQQTLTGTIIPESDAEAHRRGLRAFLETGREVKLNRRSEVIARDRAGRAFPVELTICPLRLQDRWTFSAFIRDIRDRRTAEAALRDREAQLLQAQKMEAVGRLAGGIAHDFNNLLTTMLGYGRIVLEGLEPGQRFHQEIEQIVGAAERAARLTQHLKAFAYREIRDARALDLNAVVTGIEPLLRRTLGEDIELVIRTDPDLPAIRADTSQLEQVIMNLAINARDAMPEGGRLTIETAPALLDESHCRQYLRARPGPHVLLRVADTGVGMSEEVMRHMFEPFFTTKEHGKGTGLGLSTVYGIVQQHGGHLRVESRINAGAAFHLYFPQTTTEAETVRVQTEDALPRGTETVLVVEDEISVRQLVAHILTSLGYPVLTAAHGADAVEIARQLHRPLDLLLSDVVMPQMSGLALARRLREIWPGLKVLFMSGFTNILDGESEKPAGPIHLIQKPFTHEKLARKLREVLDRAPAD
jgi:two-component system cell cycle sensor histidine kinase/response regulator CckA